MAKKKTPKHLEMVDCNVKGCESRPHRVQRKDLDDHRRAVEGKLSALDQQRRDRRAARQSDQQGGRARDRWDWR